MEYQCQQCGYRFNAERRPYACPYCGEAGTAKPTPTADELLNEVNISSSREQDKEIK